MLFTLLYWKPKILSGVVFTVIFPHKTLPIRQITKASGWTIEELQFLAQPDINGEQSTLVPRRMEPAGLD